MSDHVVYGWLPRRRWSGVLLARDGITAAPSPSAAWAGTRPAAEALAATLNSTNHLGLRWTPRPKGEQP